jgi:hypothetical protein
MSAELERLLVNYHLSPSRASEWLHEMASATLLPHCVTWRILFRQLSRNLSVT